MEVCVRRVSMKRIVSRLIVVLTIVALVFGVLPADRAEAAKKKSKTSITVSTQEELVKALKSGKYKKITIKTDAKVSFTLAAKYSSSDLKIVINAKNATFNSKGTVGSIVVNEAKTVKEYASGNYITVNDEMLTFKAMGGASVEKLKIASETGEVRVVNNGDISRVDVTGKSKVDVEQNGNVGRLYVAAAAEIGVTGTSEEKLAVTVKPEAAGAAVKSELPVKVNAYADVDLQLEKGAENSAVTLKNEDAGVKLENNTDKKVTVTDSDGVEQTVKKGEDLTSDNYVGKPEETDDGTEGEISGTPSDETRGDKKEDETATPDPGPVNEGTTTPDPGQVNEGTTTPDPGPINEGTTTPDTETKPVVDEPKETTAGLKEKLSKAGQKAKEQSAGGNAGPELVKLTSDLDLEDSITIPTGVTLLIGDSNKKVELDARSFLINLSENSQIIVSDGSKLRVAAKNVKFPYEKSDKHVEAMIGIKAGAKFEYGNYVFTAKADRGYNDPDEPLCSFIWWCDKDKRWDEFKKKDIKFFIKAVSVQNNGGTVTVSSQGLGFDEILGVFDVGKRFSDIRGIDRYSYEFDRNAYAEGVVFSFVDFTHRDNIICEKFVTDFEKDGASTLISFYQNSEVDWLNAYLDPKRAGEITAAIKAGRKSKVKIDESKYASDGTVEILNADNRESIQIKGELCIPAGSMLVTNLPLDMSEYGSLKIMGTFESKYWDTPNSGLGVSLSYNQSEGASHQIVEMCGPDARLIMGNNNKDEYYFKFFSDGELNEESIREKIDPEQQMLVIERTTETIDGSHYYPVIWKYCYTGKNTEEGTTRLKVYRKTKEQNDSDGVEVVEHPFNDGLISLEDLKTGNVGKITTKHQLVRFLDWSNSDAIDGVCIRFETDTDKNLSLPGRQSQDGEIIPWELGGVTLEVNDYTASDWDSLTIRNDAILKVNKGGMLAVESVESIGSEATAGYEKALALEYAQPSGNGGRVDVCSGGALMIRDIRISAPGDPGEGSGDDKVVISLTAEKTNQGLDRLKLQVPSNAVYVRVENGNETSLTIGQVRQSFNDFAIDIVEKGPTSASSGG